MTSSSKALSPPEGLEGAKVEGGELGGRDVNHEDHQEDQHEERETIHLLPRDVLQCGVLNRSHPVGGAPSTGLVAMYGSVEVNREKDDQNGYRVAHEAVSKWFLREWPVQVDLSLFVVGGCSTRKLSRS